jgi:hypothetical protein
MAGNNGSARWVPLDFETSSREAGPVFQYAELSVVGMFVTLSVFHSVISDAEMNCFTFL